jgi:MFS family permease
MLGFVYWNDAIISSNEVAFNGATTSGCIVGMLFFGLTADIFGRRKMYGLELILLMAGTIGVVMSSTGYVPLDQVNPENLESIDYGSFGSMNIHSWLLFWRFISGVGIGGDYPLSAVIVSEFSSTKRRPQLLAIVFAMQSLAITTGSIVSLIVAKVVQAHHTYDPANPVASARIVDQMWRWVFGLGLFPALFTAIMRFTIPESPRYTLDVLDDPSKALRETERFSAVDSWIEMSEHPSDDDISEASQYLHERNIEVVPVSNGQDKNVVQPDYTLVQYFWVEGYWKYIFATSLSWFLVDFALYSLDLNSTPTISKLWYNSYTVKNSKVWNSHPMDPNASIFSIIIENSIHSLLITSAPAITGAVLLILLINRLNRKRLTWVMFLVSGTMLVVTGAALKAPKNHRPGIGLTLYALCKLANVFGVGPLTFIIPAELFPTKYRASCHGISAAIGKLGSVIAFIFADFITFGQGASKITSFNSPITWLSNILMIFAAPMFLGALVCWLWLPDLQDSSGENKILELLASGEQRTATEND